MMVILKAFSSKTMLMKLTLVLHTKILHLGTMMFLMVQLFMRKRSIMMRMKIMKRKSMKSMKKTLVF